MKRNQNTGANAKQTTQEALKNAAIKVILERGFAGATLAPILAEAGLSKGAMFHHFSSRDTLMAAAYMQVLTEMMEAEQALAVKLRAQEIDLHAFLTHSVTALESDNFYVTMELAVAIRTRPKILEAADFFRGWTDYREAYWQSLFDLPGRDAAQAQVHWDMLGYALRGIGMRYVFGTEQKTTEELARELEYEFFSDAVLRVLDDQV